MKKKYDSPTDKPKGSEHKCSLCSLLKTDCNLTLGVPVCNNCWGMNTEDFKFYRNNRKNFFPEIDQITEKVFLGNEDAQRDKDYLKTLGITHILVVGSGLEIFHPLEFEYKKFEVNDFPFENIAKHFEEAFIFIDKNPDFFIH